MKKQTTIILILLACTPVFSQVGIGTETPQATLDVTGIPDDASQMDGIIAPRITGAELNAKAYTSNQTGAILYVTEEDPVPSGQTVNVTSEGYYYFDGTIWQKMTGGSPVEIDGVIGNEVLNATPNKGLVRVGTGTDLNPYTLGLTDGSSNGQVMTWNGSAWNPANPVNIYNSNGTLTSNRTVTLDGNNLIFTSLNQRTQISTAAGLRQEGLASSSTKHASINVSAPDNNGNGMSSNGFFQIYPENALQLIATNDATGLNLTTSQTTGSAPISFWTNPGGVAGTLRAEISGDGRFNIVNTLSVGYTGQQTFTGTQRLKINGSIVAAAYDYPDYVFEDYFEGRSGINTEYKFQSIYEVEKFLKSNKHLPGVTSIKELEKTENGYLFNVSELSIQSLEKIEELYLYTIEQQKQIDELTCLVKTLQEKIQELE